MKKIVLVMTLLTGLFYLSALQTRADSITYPFDSIKITSAYKFDIEIEGAPTAGSLLEGSVIDGDILTVYVGELEYYQDGSVVSASPSILIVTDALGNDLASFLINSYALQDPLESFSYGSWITIDPEVGVIKDFTVPLFEVSVIHMLLTDIYQFQDDAGTIFPMIPGTFVSETGLDILISAYAGGD